MRCIFIQMFCLGRHIIYHNMFKMKMGNELKKKQFSQSWSIFINYGLKQVDRTV